jgi:hypothetical protein
MTGWVDASSVGTATLDATAVSPGTVDVAAIADGWQVGSDAGGCQPWTSVNAQPFVASAIDPLSTAKAMAGTWVGKAHSPWNSDWILRVSFGVTGTLSGVYSAVGYSLTTNETTPAFYYGSDLDCDLKQWWIANVVPADPTIPGVAGSINVTFEYPPQACYLPTWQGDLSNVELNASLTRLQFSFSRSDGYGPVNYDLWRVCP